MGKMITFSRPDGKECAGYYSEPPGQGSAPGIVVIQEWWGLNEDIRRVADRVAGAGYRALAPDLYRGRVTLEAAEAAHLMDGLDFQDAATEDIRGAVQHLRLDSAKVATIGFCLGGALAILTGIHVPENNAVVCWYGIPPEGTGDPASISVPVQGHFALEDSYFTPAQVDALEAELKKGGVRYEFFRYPANHAFGNETAPNYDPEAARIAWQRSFDFLARYCK